MEYQQLDMIHKFNAENRIPFNPILFQEADVGIIDYLKKVILSCERDRVFTIKVEGFEVIEDYDQIMNKLRDYEATLNKNNNKDNVYDYINLKETDMRLLVVHYYIAIKDEEDHIEVLIGTPRSVDKYYFRINGNVYSAMWQIVDASTYNSATSSSKKDSITLKTLFQPLRVYRYQTNKKTSLVDYVTGELVPCSYFTSYVFKKSLLAMKYILAKYGFYEAVKFFHFNYISVFDHDPLLEDRENLDPKDIYVFERFGIYVVVPIQLFNDSVELQSFVYTICQCITKGCRYSDFFTIEFWLLALAAEFNNDTIDKGLSILDSLEFVLDKITQEELALPDEDKQDVYHILRWMIMEFSSLRLKNNLDISIKRVRRPQYCVALYAMKVSTSIYHISDIGKKATIDTIKKALKTSPMYLLNAIANCKLVNYRNYVNDLDALVALKYTFKGVSGIGEKSNSMPNIYRAVSKYQLGITDPDSSSPGDPGASGTICPTAKVYDNGMLSEYKEPNTWRYSIDAMFEAYRKTKGLKECMIAVEGLLGGDTSDTVEELDQHLIQFETTVNPLIKEVQDSYEEIQPERSSASVRRIFLDSSNLIEYNTYE